MKKNVKKIATALVAANVLASTLITALPPVQTHAAENKLAGSMLKATTGQGNIINKVCYGDTVITGHIPNGAGQTVTVNLGVFYAEPPSVGIDTRTYNAVYTATTTADANGDYILEYAAFNNKNTSSMIMDGTWLRPALVTVRSMGITAEAVVQMWPDYSGYINTFKTTDRVISGHIDNMPNHPIKVTDDKYGATLVQGVSIDTTTNANGDFSVTFPMELTYGNVTVSSIPLEKKYCML